MDLQEVGFCGMDWIELAQDRNRGGHFYCSNEQCIKSGQSSQTQLYYCYYVAIWWKVANNYM